MGGTFIINISPEDIDTPLCISVEISDDQICENAENFSVILESSDLTVIPDNTSGLVIINDNDGNSRIFL